MRFPLSNSPCCWKTVILKKKEKIDLLHLESESAHPSSVAGKEFASRTAVAAR
jgi:hypothetical protein